jgi:hypothetical protein
VYADELPRNGRRNIMGKFIAGVLCIFFGVVFVIAAAMGMAEVLGLSFFAGLLSLVSMIDFDVSDILDDEDDN